MRKTIFIHIGSHKTGTTAIQKFLSMNREVLAGKGYLYPGRALDHSDIPRNLRFSSPDLLRNDPDLEINRIFQEIRQADQEHVILSSEIFETQGPLPLSAYTGDEFRMQIICYVRRQDERIESKYSQVVKHNFVRDSITGYIGSGYFQRTDYRKVLEPWKDVYGKENIIVRGFEAEQMPGGIYHDFLGVLGLAPDPVFEYPKKRLNRKLNPDLLELMRLSNVWLKEHPEMHRMVKRAIMRTNMRVSGNARSSLSPAQRRDLIAMYDESNREVAREYLGRPDGRLFYAPVPDPDEPWEPAGLKFPGSIITVFALMRSLVPIVLSKIR